MTGPNTSHLQMKQNDKNDYKNEKIRPNVTNMDLNDQNSSIEYDQIWPKSILHRSDQWDSKFNIFVES